MRLRPIFMNAPMVRTLLFGKKTQTRRLVSPQPVFDSERNIWFWRRQFQARAREEVWSRNCVCPLGKPGDRLYNRRGVPRP